VEEIGELAEGRAVGVTGIVGDRKVVSAFRRRFCTLGCFALNTVPCRLLSDIC